MAAFIMSSCDPEGNTGGGSSSEDTLPPIDSVPMFKDQQLVLPDSLKPITYSARPRKPKPGTGGGGTGTGTGTTAGAKTLFIDFDGANVNSTYWGNVSTCAPSGMDNAGITTAVAIVQAAYVNNNVVVTTDEAVFNAAGAYDKVKVIVTITSAWYPGVSGIAYVGSLDWGNGTPAFVFSDRLYFNPVYVGKIITHEAGHTFYLLHQSTYNPDGTLWDSYSLGANGYAPYMGNPFYSTAKWWIGTTTGPTTYQNDTLVLNAHLGRK